MAEPGFLERANAFFLSQGYTPHQAAALAANAVAESGGNTRAVHDQGTGVGIYGFRDPEPGKGRKTALLKFAAEKGWDPYAERTQLAYAAHELETTEKAAGDRLKAAPDYRQATNAVVGYLRPQGYSAGNPTGAHNYAGRFNTGAALAGVQPMTGPTMAAAGSADTPATEPPNGLLAQLDTTKLDQLRADQAATAALQAEAAKAKEQDQAFTDLQKTGLGLLAQGQKVEQPQQAAAPPPRIDISQAAEAEPYKFITMPDFQQMLAQQRLQRRT